MHHMNLTTESELEETEEEIKTEEEEGKTFRLPEEWIYLKFDDRLFITEVNTLIKDKESLFFTMFTSRSRSHHNFKRDVTHPSKPYLFDRSGKYFEVLLNYLRTGQLIIDCGLSWEGVYFEARYFNLVTVLAKLQPYMDDFNKETRYKGHQDLSRKDIVKILVNSTTNSILRFQGLQLQGLDLSKLDLGKINFRNADLSDSNLDHCNLDNCDFRGASLVNTSMRNCRMSKLSLGFSKLEKAVFDGSVIRHCDFTKSSARGTKFEKCRISDCCFKEADLEDCNLSGSTLDRCAWKGANLLRIKRKGTNLPMGGLM